MTVTTLSAVDHRPASSVTLAAPAADNRPIYVAWGSAWAVGYGAMALDAGATPVLDLPSLVAPGLLALGLLGAAVLFGALGLGAVVGQALLLLVGPVGCLVLATRRSVREWTRPARATRPPEHGRRTQRTG